MGPFPRQPSQVSLNFFPWTPIPRTCPHTASLYSLVSGMASTPLTCSATDSPWVLASDSTSSSGCHPTIQFAALLAPCMVSQDHSPLCNPSTFYMHAMLDLNSYIIIYTQLNICPLVGSHLEEGLPRVCLLVPLIASAI